MSILKHLGVSSAFFNSIDRSTLNRKERHDVMLEPIAPRKTKTVPQSNTLNLFVFQVRHLMIN